MAYRYLADAVVLAHFGFVLFVTLGGLLIFRWPRVIWLHLPALAWGVWVELMHWICPLTYLEDALRRAAGTSAYHGDFIGQYIVPILYPAGLTPAVQSSLGIAALLLNLCISGVGWLRRRRMPRY